MKRIVFIFLCMLCYTCSKVPEPIHYGTDMCHYCKMTIVTKTHSAQMVTGKGKQYKFDAIECMIRFLEDKKELEQESNLLIANYNNPGSMINAKTSSYLVSEEINSPMGANLSGFDSLDNAQKVSSIETAQYFDWDGIFEKLNKY